MKNIFWTIGIGFLVLVIAISVVIGLNLGSLVKMGIENIGPQITKVSIKVDAVDISLLTGSAKMKGLVIGNPAGYTLPQAMKVGQMAISLDPVSVTSNKILVHSVLVESPEIDYEGNLSTNNLNKILTNVNSYTQKSPSNNNGSETSSSNSSKPNPKIEVDDFLITGARVHVNLSGLLNKDIEIPDIHLTNLGKGTDGLTPQELSSAVLGAITRDIVSSVTNILGDLRKSVQTMGKSAINSVVGNLSTNISGIFH